MNRSAKEVQQIPGPLEGIRVVDCGQRVQGGFLGTILGDLGAEVIKVEDRVGGNPCREIVRILAGQTYQVEPNFPNYIFEFCNRNKRGIVLDLGKERGREIVYKLVERSDILLQNWRIGTAEKLGLDYETLSHYNPRLIYAQASGWGPDGLLQADAAWEMTAMARTGMLDLVREPGAEPIIFPSGLGDLIGATVAVTGILGGSSGSTALRNRAEVGCFSYGQLDVYNGLPVPLLAYSWR